MVTVDTFLDTEFFGSIDLYSRKHHEMATQWCNWKETALLLLRSPRTELFWLVELYSGDVLEMAGHLAVTMGIETAWAPL